VYKEKKREKDMNFEDRWGEIYKGEKESWTKLG
jgi:hypothetical protein